MNTPIQNERKISQQATKWVVALRDADDAQRKAFAAWLKLSPRHVDHYLRTKALEHALLGLPRVEKVDAPRASSWVEGLLSLLSAFTGRRAAIAVLATLIVGVIATSYVTIFSWKSYTTAAGQFSSIALDQGAKVIVHGATQVKVRMLPWTQTLDARLVDGSARFVMTHPHPRSLRVQAGDSVFTDIGTSFQASYRREDGTASVIVLDGEVELSSASTSVVPVRVLAGNWARATPRRPIERSGTATDGSQPPRHQIAFQEQPLANLVTEINRYSRSYQFVVEDPRAASMSFAGTFNAAEPEALVWALRRQPKLSIQVDRHLVTIKSSTP